MNLFELTRLAKTDRIAAQAQVAFFIAKKFGLQGRVEINVSTVSLNSVNGTITTNNGEKLFFKFHAEEGEANTVNEYYNGQVLEQAGFPIIKPLYQSTEPGEQFLVYPFIDFPSLFDVCLELDQQFLSDKKYEQNLYTKVLGSEKKFNRLCAEKSLKNLAQTPAEDVSKQPIWQLFTYRLLAKNDAKPRVDLYYADQAIRLPDGRELPFSELAKRKWIINGVEYQESLSDLIVEASKLVNPTAQTDWMTITAHGDDHNGNKFFDQNNCSLIYFDPAFAGDRVPALLAFVKTTFHDTMAHPFWLYDPQSIEEQVKLSWQLTDEAIIIDHNWDLERVTPLRQVLFELKIEYLWKPIFRTLVAQQCLPENALDFIKKALFCCPFLVLNLIDADRYSPIMSLLALSKAVQMGSWSDRDGVLDTALKNLTK